MAQKIRLVGRGEITKIFDVSYARVVALSKEDDFPEPLDVLSVGQIWALDDVIAYAESKGRTLHLDALYGDASADSAG